MNSKIGIRAARTVEEYTKNRADRNVSWKDIERDGENAFVTAIQLFSDKLQVSLRPGARSYFPLHITALNFLAKIHMEQNNSEQNAGRLFACLL